MAGVNPRISESGILSTSLAAMMTAGRRYERWTNGYIFPWKAPEYIYTTTVAQEIAKEPYSPRVYYEYRSKYAKSEANIAGHGLRNKELKDLSRTDIIIDGKDDVPRHAIEVKRRVWTIHQITKDINRLADLVASKETTRIRSGICLFFLCSWADSRSEAKEKLKNTLEENFARSATDRRASELGSGFLISGAHNALKGRRDYQVNLSKADKLAYNLGINEDEREFHWAWTSAALVVKPARSK